MTGPPNYNTNTTGGTLQGIAQLIQGLNALRDPQAQDRARLMELIQTNPEIRDSYIQQFQNNPDALDKTLGRRPLFGRSNYDDLRGILSGPLSPEGQAKMDVAKATSAEAKNRMSVAQGLAPILEKGQKVDAFVNRGEGGTQLPAPVNPNDKAAGIQDIPVLRGPSMSDDEYQTYREALTRGGVRTPDERALAQSQLKHQTAITGLEELKATKTAEQVAQAAKDEEVSSAAIKRLDAQKKGQNLYVARKNGMLSDAEIASMQNSVRGSKRYEDDQNAYFKEQNLSIENQRLGLAKKDVARAKTEQYKMWIAEKAMTAGSPLGADQLDRAVQDPVGIMKSTDPNDAPIKEALTSIRDFAKKDMLPRAAAKYVATYTSVVNKMKGREPTQEDVDEINMAGLDFAGTGYKPPVVGLNPIDVPHTLNTPLGKVPFFPTGTKQTIGYVEKPDNIPGLPPLGVIAAPKSTSTGKPSAIKETSNEDKRAAYNSLAAKYPKESPAQIQARVLKGEK